MVELDFLKLKFQVEFLPNTTTCTSSFRNSSSTIDLEFLKLEMLVFQFVLQYDN